MLEIRVLLSLLLSLFLSLVGSLCIYIRECLLRAIVVRCLLLLSVNILLERLYRFLITGAQGFGCLLQRTNHVMTGGACKFAMRTIYLGGNEQRVFQEDGLFVSYVLLVVNIQRQ
jgi:hypothetical protein